MRKRRITDVILVICLLLAVSGADQEKLDGFLAGVRRESSAAEFGQTTAADAVILEDEWAESAWETARLQRQAEELAEMAEEQAKCMKVYGYFLAEYVSERRERDEREEQKHARIVEEQSAVLEGYGAFLTEYAAEQREEGREETAAFSLIYLDGDEVPELVVMDGKAHLCDAFVYRFEEGRTVPVGTYGQYGTLLYREKEGIIFDSYDSFGDTYDYIYQIEGSQERLLQSLSERDLTEDGELTGTIFTVDGEEVLWEQYREVYETWYGAEEQKVEYDLCRKLTHGDIREGLKKELENLILKPEESLKQEMLAKAKKPEESILLFDYDDYDGDGRFEAFAIVGRVFNSYGDVYYSGTLYFAGADGCVTELDESYGGYRMINGKMAFPPGRKYLYFYTDLVVTANNTELWTVRDGKPVDESELLYSQQVVYRGENDRNEFEVWVNGYDMTCEKGGFRSGEDMWTGHTYKPYFWYYDSDVDQIRKYGGKSISKEDFAKLSGTNIPEEIEAEGYTVGEIIRWDNDIVTINYHYEMLSDEGEPSGFIHYDNVIWDNNVKDFWRKEAMHVTSWRTAGVGGSYGL